MADLERALTAWEAVAGASTTTSSTSSSALVPQQQQQRQQAGAADAAEGLALYRLWVVLTAAAAVYRLKDASSRYSDWPSLRDDLMRLTSPAMGPAARLELHRRMLRTYAVLQP